VGLIRLRKVRNCGMYRDMETPTHATSLVHLSVNRFVVSVYGWMTVGLVVSALVASMVLQSLPLMRLLFGSPILFVLLIAELGLVVYLSTRIEKMSSIRAKTAFVLYAGLNGITLAPLLFIYTGASLASTFMITAGTFCIMAMYGYTTKKDLTSVGSLALMALLGIILASVVNIFIRSSAIEQTVTYLGVAIFVGLIAYDSQRIKKMGEMYAGDSEGYAKLAIIGALAIYLDLINLFLFLLRIFGRKRN